MSDIAKINGLAIADIEEAHGIDDIAKINGITWPHDDIPETCVGASWGSCYAVDGTTLTALRACAALTDATDDEVNPEWDGTFTVDPPGCVDRGGGVYSQYWYGTGLGSVCIGGKTVGNIELFYYTDGAPPFYECNIYLTGGSDPILVDNYKLTGATPLGTYPYDSGDCTSLDVVIVGCPA